jgi:SOS response regulatory protein OraA/RecX
MELWNPVLMDAYTLELTWLSARELSEAQLRARLRKRKIADEDIDSAVSRLKESRTLNDRRVAMAIARMESSIKHRGRARVIQKLRQAGIDGDTADDAVREVFQDVDENALLDQALERRLRGKGVKELDEKGRARIMRALVGQGFSFEAVMKRLRK